MRKVYIIEIIEDLLFKVKELVFTFHLVYKATFVAL